MEDIAVASAEASEHLEIVGDLEHGWEEVGGVFILSVYVIIAALLKLGFHQICGNPFPVPECVLLICTGLVAGGIAYLIQDDQNIADIYFTPTIFFVIILPPIVFEAGYFMPKDPFFDNLGTILTYAIFGTFFNAMAIGGSIYCVVTYGLVPGFDEEISFIHCLLFGSIISAVDPVAVIAVFDEIHVNMTLYICVFGESLLNDGVAVVLYRVFEGFANLENNEPPPSNWGPEVGRAFLKFLVVAGGGLVVGLVYGFIGSLMTKYTKHAPIIEPLLIYACAYLAYLTAEWIQLSSIIAIVFAGFFMKPFCEANMAPSSISSLHYIQKLLSSIMDITIFIFLGISAISDFWTIVFITIYRVISVYVLTFILNIGRLDRISYVDQFVMAYGGLRGGIAFSLCKLMCINTVPSIQSMLCSTIVAVFFTSFVQGMTIKPIVEWLQVKKQGEQEQTVLKEMTESVVDHLTVGIADIIQSRGRHWWMNRIANLTDDYITPILVREPDKIKNQSIIDVWAQLNVEDAAKLVQKQTDVKNYAGLENDDDDLNKIRLLLPGALVGDERINPEAPHGQEGFGGERAQTDIKMHHMLRDNLYANRQRIELSGHIKYRNLGSSSEQANLTKQQQEILVRRRIKSLKETPEQIEFRKQMRKTEAQRKTYRKTISEGRKTMSLEPRKTVTTPVTPQPEMFEMAPRKTKILFEEPVEPTPPSDLPWRNSGNDDHAATRSTQGRPQSQLLEHEKSL
ncbi:Oidioi.mRNA.OKI2018_I69.PAR.g11314.t1.cds [Oikopleura dioica]|uniref:Sodium/hydrogen exchanger n=1 Tax=Oikopleura dioica TaxID=34765 RepID=A0ABN7S1E6_OIKDI|nr:Oidioi.mRNA.OKI2018_I69.PAR.g11314.t1.cds [Oikopleura dioica]